MEQNNLSQKIMIEDQNAVSMCGVVSVDLFNEREIRLTLNDKSRILVSGAMLKISAFDNKDGNFLAVGKIFGVRYLTNGINPIKRLVK